MRCKSLGRWHVAEPHISGIDSDTRGTSCQVYLKCARCHGLAFLFPPHPPHRVFPVDSRRCHCLLRGINTSVNLNLESSTSRLIHIGMSVRMLQTLVSQPQRFIDCWNAVFAELELSHGVWVGYYSDGFLPSPFQFPFFQSVTSTSRQLPFQFPLLRSITPITPLRSILLELSCLGARTGFSVRLLPVNEDCPASSPRMAFTRRGICYICSQ